MRPLGKLEAGVLLILSGTAMFWITNSGAREFRQLEKTGVKTTGIVANSHVSSYSKNGENRTANIHTISYDGHSWSGSLGRLYPKGSAIPTVYLRQKPTRVVFLVDGMTIEQEQKKTSQELGVMLVIAATIAGVGVILIGLWIRER